MQISEGYAAIHDFPEGTTEIMRSEWQTRVHPEDAPRLEAVRNRAFRKRVNEYSADYRIVRPGGDIRWIEARSFISYRGDGALSGWWASTSISLSVSGQNRPWLSAMRNSHLPTRPPRRQLRIR